MSDGLATSNVCWVLREDPDLADTIPPGERGLATEALVAREIRMQPGTWPAHRVALDDGIGLLVLEGVILHRVAIDDRCGAELIGEGDVVRPLQSEPEPAGLRPAIEWQVLERTRLAVLDERFARQLASFPPVAGRLFARAAIRARRLAVNLAIVHQARVDVRLRLLLWHLAGRWGKVRPDGVLVPLHLTHAVLADLVAARRPTVTSALARLGRRELVWAIDEGWLLRGPPPQGPSTSAR